MIQPHYHTNTTSHYPIPLSHYHSMARRRPQQPIQSLLWYTVLLPRYRITQAIHYHHPTLSHRPTLPHPTSPHPNLPLVIYLSCCLALPSRQLQLLLPESTSLESALSARVPDLYCLCLAELHCHTVRLPTVEMNCLEREPFAVAVAQRLDCRREGHLDHCSR